MESDNSTGQTNVVQTAHDSAALPPQHHDDDAHIDLYIKLENTRHIVIRQRQTFTFMRLLSELGGALSLIMGASILTLAEIVDVLIVGCAASTRHDEAASKAVRAHAKSGESAHRIDTKGNHVAKIDALR